MTSKSIRDPVHGDIEFDAEELKLIDSSAVQRLRGIKQLGASLLVAFQTFLLFVLIFLLERVSRRKKVNELREINER